MDKKEWFDRETFLRIAEGAGLKPGDPHLEELYAYLQDVLPGLRVIDELDLKDVEPLSSPGSYGETGKSTNRQGGEWPAILDRSAPPRHPGGRR